MRKKGLPVWVWILSLILIVYIIYIIYLLYPYLKMFLDNKYVIEPNDLPSYKDVFNSIFLVAQIIITSILTFLLECGIRDGTESSQNTYNWLIN